MIRLGHGLVLPLETATETTLIVGKRGGGKSNTAVAMAEEFYRAKIPFAVLDPVDTWYGLKAGKDGTPDSGLGIYVFGGEHADIPLEHTAGSMMADVLVEHRISAVFVIRQFSNRQKAQFVSDFAGQLFKRNREVFHLFCEEAHEVMPQQPYKGEEEMLGRMLKLQKLGRSSGIGLTSITQRPASLNKNATTQAEILIAHRILGPQDMAAVEAWIKYHNVENQKRDVLESLPLLKTGEAWIWAPDFPEQQPIGLQRVKIREAHTFDSRKTPKPGERRTEIKALADVDLEKLRAKMSATIEKAKAEDPKQLRAKITELQRELNLARSVTPTKAEPTIKEVPVLKDKQLAQLETFCTKLMREAERHGSAMSIFWSNLNQVAESLLKAIKSTGQDRLPAPLIAHPIIQKPRGAVTSRSVKPSGEPGSEIVVSRSQQRILNALIWAEGIGLAYLDKTQLALLADQSPTSGGYFNNLGALRTAGLIEYPGSGAAMLTAAGRAQAHPLDVPTTSAELHEMLFAKLPNSQSRILKVLIACYPKAMSKDALAVQAEQSSTSGGYFNNLGRLRTLGLISYPSPGHAVAQRVLFLE
jgi:helicase HerA-like protein